MSLGGRISPHFRLEEFRSRDGADVPYRSYDDLEALCQQLLEPLRREFGRVVITSGYRTKARNRAVGGAPRSYHRYDIRNRRGVAADFQCAMGTPGDWYAFLGGFRPGGMGLYTTFVHVDNRTTFARW